MVKYLNEDENAFRRLQSVVNDSIRRGEDCYSDDEPSTSTASTKPTGTTGCFQSFKLPQKLRGWLLLDRAHLPYREHTSILTSTATTLYGKVRTVL